MKLTPPINKYPQKCHKGKYVRIKNGNIHRQI